MMAGDGAEGFALLKAADGLSEEAFHEFRGVLHFGPGHSHDVCFGDCDGLVGLEDAQGWTEGHEGRDQSEDRFVTIGVKGCKLDDAPIDEPNVVVVQGNRFSFAEGLKSASVIASFEKGFQKSEFGPGDRG